MLELFRLLKIVLKILVTFKITLVIKIITPKRAQVFLFGYKYDL
jgi:hypothetical protein